MATKKKSNIEIGKIGEDIAEDFLREKKFLIIGRNLRTAYGEIDILCQEGDCLVFVEVKSRRSKQFGCPENAVNSQKQDHMINSALAYLQENDAMDQLWRIDVIAINFGLSKEPQIRWFKNAVTS